MNVTFPDDLVDTTGGRIVLLVLDGLGGLPLEPGGPTELEAASTPNLDALARRAALGLHQPVGYGITPGSGPGHLALFGYDPARYNIGRGVLSALGVDFPLEPGDIAIRLNFATIDAQGRVTDRRAGRPSDDENRRLIAKLREGVQAPGGLKIFFESEKEHRAVLVLRGRALSAELGDTDPQEEGVPPLPVTPLSPDAAETAQLLQQVLDRSFEVLSDEKTANALLARGIDAYHPYPTFESRYRLRAEAIARYPMYRGVARLLGMETQPGSRDDAESIRRLKANFDRYDYHFVHFKAVDSRGEDGDFDAKVAAIEAVDALIGELDIQPPDVLVVTGDHSTPSKLRSHSWHPVPVMIVSQWVRPDPGAVFGERACARGELGIFPAKDLMTLMLAHAGRLAKFGA
ncbi:MAG: 2,3-bisphosphoglycerate-independent phosphoglycerate mutase [Candidatus Cloacimonetes bacterium]|jgi:2,3-bisphosphoglycerate-independent phosphoglycerate mutase|nr:2,3-bisphosphoglycerate-independent phosphoglycerate mutase [Candidatus Cloacimonadota bacterium]